MVFNGNASMKAEFEVSEDELKAAQIKTMSEVEKAFDRLATALSELDDANEELASRLSVAMCPASTPAQQGNDDVAKEPRELSKLVMGILDASARVYAVKQRIQRVIERLEL